MHSGWYLVIALSIVAVGLHLFLGHFNRKTDEILKDVAEKVCKD